MLTLFLSFIVSGPVVVFLHEMGHALPALAFTKGKVTVYIGSLGDPNDSKRFRLGRLEIWFKYNVFPRSGLCVPGEGTGKVRNLLITLGGPIASALVGYFALYFVFYYDAHGSIKILLTVFYIAALLDLVMNLVPMKRPVQLHDGTFTFNDGRQLLDIIRGRDLLRIYHSASLLYKEHKYEEAIELYEDELQKRGYDTWLCSNLLNLYIHIKAYDKAETHYETLKKKGHLSPPDLMAAFMFCYMQKRNDEALEHCEKLITINKQNCHAHMYLACALIEKGDYEKAIEAAETGSQDEKNIPYACCYKGIAFRKLGDHTKAEEFIKQAIELNPADGEFYKAYGMLRVTQDQLPEAKNFFIKAKELHADTLNIDKCIAYCDDPSSMDISEID